MRQVLSMKPVNVRQDGLFPKVIETYEYMFRHTDPKYIAEYGYLDGSVFLMGPLETAAVIRGYADFLLELYDEPELVHELLRMVTDTLIEWLRHLETRIGTLKRIFVADHFPTQISAVHFEEFFFPYMREIYAAFPSALTMYHNEGLIDHVLQRIPDLGASLFHFGTEAAKTREAIGSRMCLMGNIDPIQVMLYGSAEEVRAACRNVLERCAPGGGLLLSSAGGLSVRTPEANVRAMLEATAEYAAGKG
jgi:uroporphyrinogen decarboxylase